MRRPFCCNIGAGSRPVDRSVTDLWPDGLQATRDFEGTRYAFLGVEASLSAMTIARTNQRLCVELDGRMLDDSTILNWSSSGRTASILALAWTTSGACS